jgi:hypothetical protein
MHESLSCDEIDWTSFVAQYWDRTPVLISARTVSGLISERDILEAFAAAAAELRSGKDNPDVQFFRGDAAVSAGKVEYLPGPEESLARYRDRLDSLGIGDFFAFLKFNLAQYAPQLWPRLRRFIGGLLEQVGLPAAGIGLDAIIARNRGTPFGVHRDDLGDFSFIVSGHKTMRFWDPEELAPRFPQARAGFTHMPRVHLDEAQHPGQAITGTGGQLIYWPGHLYHSGRSEEVSITVNLSLFFGNSGSRARPSAQLLQRCLRELLEREMTLVAHEENAGQRAMMHRIRPSSTPDLAHTLPSDLLQAVELVSQALASGALLERAQIAWLRSLSCLGLVNPPPKRSLALPPRLRRIPDAPLLWAPSCRPGASSIICAAGGHTVQVPASPPLFSALRRLEGETELDTQAFLEAHPAVRSELEAVLTHLCGGLVFEPVLTGQAALVSAMIGPASSVR